MVKSLLEILTKITSMALYKPIDAVENAVGESISSIGKWSIVYQLGKDDFSFG